MSDEGFHEIQLNGKQLVFLFMAGTVVFVVVFLCGVLVGRGVQAERVTDLGEPAVPAAAVVSGDDEASAAGGEEPAATAPPTPAEGDLSYYQRLESDAPVAENLEPKAAAPADEPAPARPEPARAETAAAAAAPSTVAGEPAGPGFAVQIAALSEQDEAERVVSRLAGKGYAAYLVMPSASGPAGVYRVRVGKFKTRGEAEGIAARLEKEEQFKPWIIR